MELRNDIWVRDSLFDPRLTAKTAYYYHDSNGKTYYKVWIFLDGVDLPFIDYVTYKFDPTFHNMTRNVKRRVSNHRCKFPVWAHGPFKVDVDIYLKNGSFLRTTRNSFFDRQIKDDVKYVEEIP